MEKHLFLGDEAVAQAAIDAGLSGDPFDRDNRIHTGFGRRKGKGDSLPLEHE